MWAAKGDSGARRNYSAQGGAAHITPPPAFFGRAAWRVSTGNKALHGLFCRTTRRAFLFYPKMWPRLPWGGREAPKDTDFAPPPSPDSCMELTAWMFSMLPSRTLLMTFYCYYQSPCKELQDSRLELLRTPILGAVSVGWGQASRPPAHYTIPVGRNASSGIRFPPPWPGRGGAEPTKGGREEKISTAPRAM